HLHGLKADRMKTAHCQVLVSTRFPRQFEREGAPVTCEKGANSFRRRASCFFDGNNGLAGSCTAPDFCARNVRNRLKDMELRRLKNTEALPRIFHRAGNLEAER